MADEISKYAMENAYKGVERDALERTRPQESPRAVVLGGQPGSGKSELAGEAIREMRQSGGAVVIDADRMREENPRYKQLSKDDPQNAADRTQKEAGEWATRLTMAAVEERRNLVVDGTMRNAENVRDLTTRLKDAGYDVEARVMAVNPETSITRARLRFEEQVSERGSGRFVNQEQHDKAYAELPRSVAALEAEKLVDRIKIYDSNQRPIYENAQERGEWKAAPEAAQALERERGRDWSHAEKRDYVSALEDIAALTKQRTQGSDEVIEGKLNAARTDLTRIEQSTEFQRAEAFNHLPKGEALAKHPELDGAYAQLRDLRQQMSPGATQHEREQSYFAARSDLVSQLERGEVPKGSVTKEESARVIDIAAESRGIKSVRDSGELQRDVKGEVVAASSHHALVALSDNVAVRFEKGSLDREVKTGDAVVIQYGADKSHVYEQGKEPPKDQVRDNARDLAR